MVPGRVYLASSSPQMKYSPSLLMIMIVVLAHGATGGETRQRKGAEQHGAVLYTRTAKNIGHPTRGSLLVLLQFFRAPGQYYQRSTSGG